MIWPGGGRIGRMIDSRAMRLQRPSSRDSTQPWSHLFAFSILILDLRWTQAHGKGLDELISDGSGRVPLDAEGANPHRAEPCLPELSPPGSNRGSNSPRTPAWTRSPSNAAALSPLNSMWGD